MSNYQVTYSYRASRETYGSVSECLNTLNRDLPEAKRVPQSDFWDVQQKLSEKGEHKIRTKDGTLTIRKVQVISLPGGYDLSICTKKGSLVIRYGSDQTGAIDYDSAVAFIGQAVMHALACEGHLPHGFVK